LGFGIYISAHAIQKETRIPADSKDPAAVSTGRTARQRRARRRQAEDRNGFETCANGKRALAWDAGAQRLPGGR